MYRAQRSSSPAGARSVNRISGLMNIQFIISWLRSTAATHFRKSPTKVSSAGSFPTLLSTLVMPALPLPWSRMSFRWTMRVRIMAQFIPPSR